MMKKIIFFSAYDPLDQNSLKGASLSILNNTFFVRKTKGAELVGWPFIVKVEDLEPKDKNFKFIKLAVIGGVENEE